MGSNLCVAHDIELLHIHSMEQYSMVMLCFTVCRALQVNRQEICVFSLSLCANQNNRGYHILTSTLLACYARL